MTETPALRREHMTEEDIALLKQTHCLGWSEQNVALFVHQCNRSGLDPLSRQIYGQLRWDKNMLDAKGKKVGGLRLTVVTSIDGFRLVANRSGEYEGQQGPYWCGADAVWKDVWLPKTYPAAAKVGVWRTGFREPTFGVANFDAFAPTYDDGNLSGLWPKMFALMIAKCFDEETEVLTDRGFELFVNVQGRVLQVTSKGLEPTDAKPFSKVWHGEMVTLDSDDLNFSVTPNHDMLTTKGKIEAAQMFDSSRARGGHIIPRCVPSTLPEHLVSDEELQLAAAYLADGTDVSLSSFRIEVSRPRKVSKLNAIGQFKSCRTRLCAGDVAHAAGRDIRTLSDKVSYLYGYGAVSWLCLPGKKIRPGVAHNLSARQARLFVDTWIEFDGSQNKTSGVRRFYSSREEHCGLFEVAAVVAGYSVSVRRARTSDISSRDNYCITISDRSEIKVKRWNRPTSARPTGLKRTGLELTTNTSGVVWCVTVPSGVIVVRRKGFSMQCGNCAEAQALRKAFPQELGSLYITEEMDQAPAPVDPTKTEDRAPDASKGERSAHDERPQARGANDDVPPPEETPEETPKPRGGLANSRAAGGVKRKLPPATTPDNPMRHPTRPEVDGHDENAESDNDGAGFPAEEQAAALGVPKDQWEADKLRDLPTLGGKTLKELKPEQLEKLVALGQSYIDQGEKRGKRELAVRCLAGAKALVAFNNPANDNIPGL
jgi:RecT family